MSRANVNRDYIKRLNYPAQSYALSGMDWGDASENKTRDKLEIVGSPMFISPLPPGVTADDPVQWQQTYGASQDATLSIFDGQDLSDNIDAIPTNLSTPYRDALPTAANSNLYSKANSQQQIQFVVSKDDPDDFRQSSDFGSVSEARGIMMRGPMQMVGWGRTIGMRPTDPNPLDERKNDDLHKLDRSTWKPGPVDLRWDEKRGIWRGWQDLIADHDDTDLGTFVFSTNPDDTCGFPFLRGKLDDVWWVRRTNSAGVIRPGDDITSTAEVCTTLKHKLYDPVRNGAGGLWDIFICHNGAAVSCGAETTFIGSTSDVPPSDNSEIGQGSLEIRTTVVYHYSDAFDGPIHFVADPLLPDDIPGKMKLVNGRWCPVVNFDEDDNNILLPDICRIPGATRELVNLYDNDVALADLLTGFLIGGISLNTGASYCDYINTDLTTQIDDNFTAIGATVQLNNSKLEAFATSISTTIVGAINSALATVKSAMKAQDTQLQVALQTMATSINACLAACCGEEFATCVIAPEITPVIVDTTPLEISLGIELLGLVTGEMPKHEFDISTPIDEPCNGKTNTVSIICQEA